MIQSSDFYDWITARCDIVGESDGHEVVLVCPWCGRPKLYTNPDRAVFVCFRCRERGRAEHLVAKVEGVTLSVAKERLRARTVPSEDDLFRALGSLSRTGVEREPPPNHELPEEFIPCFTAKGWRVPRYLDRREVTDSMIIRHGLGYAKEGRYRNRVIIPIVQGSHRTFLTRLMGKPEAFAWEDRETGETVTPPKYMTPRDAGLSRVLYGSTWIPEGSHVIMVEGSFDVMRLTDHGFATGGILGKSLSVAQAILLSRLRPKSVTFLYDAGAYAEACKDADTLSHRIDPDECPVYVARCPDEEDPDSLALEGGRSAIEDVLASREEAGSGWAGLDAMIADL